MPPILCWKRSTAASFVGSKDGLGLCCATSGSATEAWDLWAKVWRNDCEYNVDGKNGLVCRVMGVNNGGIISGQRFWNLMEFHLFWTQIITKMLWTLTSLVHLSPCIFLSLDGFHRSVVWAGQPMGRCDRTSELVLAQCLEFHGRFVWQNLGVICYCWWHSNLIIGTYLSNLLVGGFTTGSPTCLFKIPKHVRGLSFENSKVPCTFWRKFHEAVLGWKQNRGRTHGSFDFLWMGW